MLFTDPPEQPYFKEKAVIGKTFAITCESDGHPSPRYTIIHNNTKIVSNDRTYTMDVVQHSDAGLYKCIAENKLGNSSTMYYLSILGKIQYFQIQQLTVFTTYFHLSFNYLLVIIHCLQNFDCNESESVIT